MAFPGTNSVPFQSLMSHTCRKARLNVAMLPPYHHVCVSSHKVMRGGKLKTRPNDCYKHIAIVGCEYVHACSHAATHKSAQTQKQATNFVKLEGFVSAVANLACRPRRGDPKSLYSKHRSAALMIKHHCTAATSCARLHKPGSQSPQTL